MGHGLFSMKNDSLKIAGLLLALSFAVLPSQACSTPRQLEIRPADSLFFIGETFFDNYQYDSALPFFEELIFRLDNRKLQDSDISFGIQACNCAGIIHMIHFCRCQLLVRPHPRQHSQTNHTEQHGCPLRQAASIRASIPIIQTSF